MALAVHIAMQHKPGAPCDDLGSMVMPDTSMLLERLLTCLQNLVHGHGRFGLAQSLDTAHTNLQTITPETYGAVMRTTKSFTDVAGGM